LTQQNTLDPIQPIIAITYHCLRSRKDSTDANSAFKKAVDADEKFQHPEVFKRMQGETERNWLMSEPEMERKSIEYEKDHSLAQRG
jgi:hypothetical protein